MGEFSRMDADDPLPAATAFTVGLAYNLKKGIAAATEDAEAEYDNIETIEALESVFGKAGLKTVRLEQDAHFMTKVMDARPDFVFNIAEGIGGRSREGQVPAMLDILGIPYSGSDTTTLCVALDKALTKRILRGYRVPTPAYLELLPRPVTSHPRHRLRFPVITKPSCEGSSKGISDLAIADNDMELQGLLERNFRLYGQTMLVEEYIAGREFTVGLLGNGEALRVFEPMEICYLDQINRENSIYSFNVKKNYQQYVRYECPAKLDKKANSTLKRYAATAFNALHCRDFARADFRLGADGTFHFIEINPLPGLAPGYSDYPMLAAANGVDYEQLVLAVLNAALQRHGLPTARFLQATA